MLESKAVKEALSVVEAGDAKLLGLSVGGRKVEKPGQYIPRADAQAGPELTFAGASGEYIAVALDLDAPYKTASFLGPILHWMQPGFKAPGGEGAQSLAYGETPFISDYIGPAPPPGSGPHRYIFFLYDQPADFDATKYAPPAGQKFSTVKRIRYNIDDFARQAKLGPIVAANYFTSN